MATARISSLASLVCFALFVSGSVNAQSISMGSLSGSSFCAGDTISVGFTATGFFGHKNAFTLQLSDPTGSFGNFHNIGSLTDTLPGTFAIHAVIPPLNSSTHYRMRVISAIPYMATADNGSDLSIGTGDHHRFQEFTAWTINTPFTFNLFEGQGNVEQRDSLYWQFDSGADPQTASGVFNRPSTSQTTTYSTAGPKTVVATSVSPVGCVASDTLLTYIFDCSPRAIPHNAYVIDKGMDLDHNDAIPHLYANIWVNPGVTVTGGEFDTIYAEAGSTIGDGPGNTVFLHPGAIYNGRTAYVVVYADGASVDPKFAGGPTLHCSALDFDYTDAPPNAAFPHSAVAINSVPDITISPNPTSGIVSIHNAPAQDMDISVLSILGETLMQKKSVQQRDISLDLTKLASGTYYIRISWGSIVITKKIVRD